MLTISIWDIFGEGFTYKGFISEHEEFDIFFFHLLINFEETRNAWNWVTYQVGVRFTSAKIILIIMGTNSTMIMITMINIHWYIHYQAEREYITFSDMIIPGGPTLTQSDQILT